MKSKKEAIVSIKNELILFGCTNIVHMTDDEIETMVGKVHEATIQAFNMTSISCATAAANLQALAKAASQLGNPQCPPA